MELMLDTANLDAIKKGAETLPLSGITTNPSIIKKEGKINYFEHLKAIRKIIGFDNSLHVQVVAKDFAGMMADAEAILSSVDKEVFIKVPVTEAGIKLIRELKRQEVNVTATAIYSNFQAYLAIAAGADYIAPYYNRMDNLNIDPARAISEMAGEISRTHSAAKILAASFKNIGQVNTAIENGAQSVTIAPEIVTQALMMPSVLKAVDDFSADWESVFGEKKDIASLL
ncbi:fructose-6-phosphate aldolase [Lactovum odontotermitis]